jgi:hypothetical protein
MLASREVSEMMASNNSSSNQQYAEMLAHGYTRQRMQALLGCGEMPAGETPVSTAPHLGAYKEVNTHTPTYMYHVSVCFLTERGCCKLSLSLHPLPPHMKK